MLTRSSTAWTVVALASLAIAPAAAAQYGRPGKSAPPPAPPASKDKAAKDKEKAEKAESRFYDKLDKEDRDALQANVGYVVPMPPDALAWIGGDAMGRADFRGKVTLIQSVGGKANVRAQLEKAKKALPEGATLLGVHTPEGADRADEALASNPPCLVAVDATGEWCDALGIWKKPVNIVVDKTGAVRYVGLSEAGIKAKVAELLAEEVDESIMASEKPAPAGAAAAAAGDAPAPTEWPEFLSPVQSAQDMRGKTMPAFKVQTWITPSPDPAGRLVAMDFWATWCGPCVQSIPHLNDLARKYGQDVLVVGISDEAPGAFATGMRKLKKAPADFAYSLALDPSGALKNNFFGIRGIPHMAIASPDGVIRWQGHPMTLQEQDLEKLIAANRALSKPAAGKSTRGWAAAKDAKDAQKSR
jgi:cytochrome c biogenesis protein CcmG/thiol:disulfide interchange protein DsbE